MLLNRIPLCAQDSEEELGAGQYMCKLVILLALIHRVLAYLVFREKVMYYNLCVQSSQLTVKIPFFHSFDHVGRNKCWFPKSFDVRFDIQFFLQYLVVLLKFKVQCSFLLDILFV